MIPFVQVEVFQIGPIHLGSFIAMVGAGSLAGCAITIFRGHRRGLSVARVEELCAWILLLTYLGAHAGGWLYRPGASEVLLAQPWLLFTAGLSSFGGFAGALTAAVLFFRLRRIGAAERWKYADSIGFALPFAWILGRIGCSLVHDHPGIRSMSWIAVSYPEGPRHDLGVLEVFFLASLCIAFLVLDRNPHPPGFFFGAFFLPYGIFRLLIEPLRLAPIRYLGWTVDQYAGSAAVCLGIWSLARLYQARLHHKHFPIQE